jgi:hypothetical protein
LCFLACLVTLMFRTTSYLTFLLQTWQLEGCLAALIIVEFHDYELKVDSDTDEAIGSKGVFCLSELS